MKALTRKWFEVKIFTLNHLRTHTQREREREREPRSLLRPSSIPMTTDRSRRTVPYQRQSSKDQLQRRSHHTDRLQSPTTHTSADCQSHRADQAKIDSNAARSRLRCAIWWIFFFWVLFLLCFCMTRFDEFFFWVLFLLCFCIDEWYYIFVWQLRKCVQQVENVFSMLFSRTQPNTIKYFSKHFLKCNQTLENIFLSWK